MDGTTYVIGAVGHHSFDEFGLIRASRPHISPFVVKTITVDNPGTNGVIDLTEVLTEYPTYKNRTITEKYILRGKPKYWDLKLSALGKVLDGSVAQLHLDTDPAYYWQGRSVVSAIEKKDTYVLVTITTDADPFKYERFTSQGYWLWDPFNFETGIIREYQDLRVEGSLTLTIIGTKMPVVPEFTWRVDDGSSLSVRFEGCKYPIAEVIDEIVIKEGSNTLKFEGYGTVSVLYRGGVL